jgi:exopolyphosphatase/pppGpp-phosphohydrolase
MEHLSSPMCAAIDVGSNTIHIVVARCFPDTLEIVADELEMVRIGESVTATGEISLEKSRAALETIQAYKALALRHGATRIFVVATEAIRQARNSAAFIAQVHKETGLEVLLISGTAEAALTFYGATYEAGQAEQMSVMDLGGGSMELVSARNMQISWRTSVPLGSGWLHDNYLTGDPPNTAEIEAAEIFLHTYFRDMSIKQTAPLLIITGGSANSLFYLVQKAFHRTDEKRRLTLVDLERCQNLLSALETRDVATLYEQPVARARILLAGTLIIRHIMKRLNLREIMVSTHGIREGVLLAYTRYGDYWLEEVSRESHAEQRFIQSAHEELVHRLHTMLEWPEEVLKHEEIEAVHKMRVASRRLRATLDAYQSCCDPQLFARVYQKVKKTTDTLGDARDTDVLLQYLAAQLADLNEEEQEGVRWMIANLQKYRQQKQQDLEAFLRKLDGSKLERLLKQSVREGKGK